MSKIICYIIDKTNYIHYLKASNDKPFEREKNLQELVSIAKFKPNVDIDNSDNNRSSSNIDILINAEVNDGKREEEESKPKVKKEE